MKLSDWNHLSTEAARTEIALCCGAEQWAIRLVEMRPYEAEDQLLDNASLVWNSLAEKDWLEAFASHPKIGERATAGDEQHKKWASQEQAGTATAEDRIKAQLKELNTKYEQKFGFIYIICATGRSAEEMLSILQLRLNNSREKEIKEAAKQQEQITAIRLRKWLDS